MWASQHCSRLFSSTLNWLCVLLCRYRTRNTVILVNETEPQVQFTAIIKYLNDLACLGLIVLLFFFSQMLLMHVVQKCIFTIRNRTDAETPSPIKAI